MVFATLTKILRGLTQRPSVPSLAELFTAEQMRRILERERARADRSGDKMAVISFMPREGHFSQKSLHHLVDVLRQRLRLTDDVGWLDEKQILAVLPATTAAGAWKVADDVCARFPDDLTPPHCTVYNYPSGHTLGSDDLLSSVGAANLTLPLETLFLRPMPLWKRTLDVIGAVTGLILAGPLVLVIGLAIKATSPGPIIFSQWRSGRGGKPFEIYKFRTMSVDAEARKEELLPRNERDGPAFKIKDDPRITPLGWLLRVTSLDELPQLWNVLLGHMSLVGPRPLPCAEAVACDTWQQRRLDVMPGLTCIWQVRGRGGVPFADWIRMDLEYIRALSPWQDVKLLLLTIPAVILRRGAH